MTPRQSQDIGVDHGVNGRSITEIRSMQIFLAMHQHAKSNKPHKKSNRRAKSERNKYLSRRNQHPNPLEGTSYPVGERTHGIASIRVNSAHRVIKEQTGVATQGTACLLSTVHTRSRILVQNDERNHTGRGSFFVTKQDIRASSPVTTVGSVHFIRPPDTQRCSPEQYCGVQQDRVWNVANGY